MTRAIPRKVNSRRNNKGFRLHVGPCLPESPDIEDVTAPLPDAAYGPLVSNLSWSHQPHRTPATGRLAHAEDRRHTQTLHGGIHKKTVTIATSLSERRETYRIVRAIEEIHDNSRLETVHTACSMA